jgi:hypothetical protein
MENDVRSEERARRNHGPWDMGRNLARGRSSQEGLASVQPRIRGVEAEGWGDGLAARRGGEKGRWESVGGGMGGGAGGAANIE